MPFSARSCSSAVSAVTAASTSRIDFDGAIGSIAAAIERRIRVCINKGCRNAGPMSIRGHWAIQ